LARTIGTIPPDDHAQLRARAETAERRQLRRAESLGALWRSQIRAERRQRERTVAREQS
jgi:hypothetical protein